MPQTLLTKVVLKENNYSVQAGDLTVAQTAADNVNGNSFQSTGREILLVNNPDVAAHTFTVTSVPDALGRSLDIATYSVASLGIAAIDMDTIAGWRQANGQVFLAVNSNLLKFVVLQLPG
jgi:hypothetical protein